jgi:hypothetical protein
MGEHQEHEHKSAQTLETSTSGAFKAAQELTTHRLLHGLLLEEEFQESH